MNRPAADVMDDDDFTHRFHLEDYPFYWLVNVHARYIQLLEIELKKVGLDPSRFRVLTLAWKYRTVTVSQLAHYAVIKMPTVTKIVSRLRDEGLVVTAVSPHDGRVTEVSATPQGAQLAEQANQLASQIFERAFAGIRPAARQKMDHTLAAILGNLHD